MAKKKNKLTTVRKKPARSQDIEKQKILASLHAAAIEYGVLEVADNLDRVGTKQSTLNRIEALRKAIVYVSATQIYPKLKNEQSESKTTDFYSDLSTIIENILPYYKAIQRKAVPAETIKELRKFADIGKRFTWGFKLKAAIETLTDEMRGLADDISPYSYPDILLIGKASVISMSLEATARDYNDQETAKSELLQAGEVLKDFALRRFWPKDAKEKRSFKQGIIDDLKTYADKLDKLPKNRSKAKDGTPGKVGKRVLKDNDIPGSRIIAMQSFEYALDTDKALLTATQSKIYQWLLSSNNKECEKNPYHDCKPPKEESWKAYIRNYCQTTHTDVDAIRQRHKERWALKDQAAAEKKYGSGPKDD